MVGEGLLGLKDLADTWGGAFAMACCLAVYLLAKVLDLEGWRVGGKKRRKPTSPSIVSMPYRYRNRYISVIFSV